jgi:hypothetical protein
MQDAGCKMQDAGCRMQDLSDLSTPSTPSTLSTLSDKPWISNPAIPRSFRALCDWHRVPGGHAPGYVT